MGYSHAWIRTRQLDPARFAEAASDCRRVCEATGVRLKGIEGRREPIFEDYLVAFDGGCEPFVVQCVCGEDSPERPLGDRPGRHFGACKTDRLPFDTCVQACIIVFNHHFGVDFQPASDGSDADWGEARQICQQVLGYGQTFHLPMQDRA